MIAIRGATTLLENTCEEIKKESINLMKQIILENNLKQEDMVSIFFSCTDDITKAYPGKFVREYFSLNNTAIMHFNEMKVEGYLPLCIRVLMLVNKKDKENIKYIYLNKAKNLRKDLFHNVK